MILRGKKLQIAMRLVAEGKMNDLEIAKLLGVSERTLETTREQPFFERRVEEIRREIILTTFYDHS